MSHSTLRQVLRYRFDNFMARGGRSIFIALLLAFAVSFAVVGGLRALVYATDSGNPKGAERNKGGMARQWYQSFNHLSDPGTMAYDIDSSLWYKATAVLGGGIGVVILSALIAFITTALDQKLHELRKGHSKVVEEGHTLILGWNERVVEILKELILANESEDDPCVVILSKVDKEEMDDFLKLHVTNPLNTRIVTRSGAESSLTNLEIASVSLAKSVIVLANCNPSASNHEKAGSDAIVIKTILAVAACLPDDSEAPLVAELFLEDNRDIVSTISENVLAIDANEVLAKVIVQTSRSVGLSVVYSEIFSFDGCEMYFHQDQWGEISFADLAFRFPDGIPMGILHSDGELEIRPNNDTMLKPDDSILILAEDDSTIQYMNSPVATAVDLPLEGSRQEQTIERELIIGWTPKVEIILREYAEYVLEGSSIDIMMRSPDESVRGEIERINEELPTINISLIEEDPATTEGLLVVKPFQYDNIIILSQGNKEGDDERTDSETIVVLLQLRSMFQAFPEESGNTKLITEILDSENQPLVARAGVHDFIITNRYISMLLAQISEDGEIKRVYDDLFQEEGSEIYLKPASLYFTEFPIEVTYADMIRIAQKREEVCLGVKIKAFEPDMNQNYGVKLIPEKNAKFTLRPEDSLVVLAEDET